MVFTIILQVTFTCGGGGGGQTVGIEGSSEIGQGGAVAFQFLFSGQSVVNFSIERVFALTIVPEAVGSYLLPWQLEQEGFCTTVQSYAVSNTAFTYC